MRKSIISAIIATLFSANMAWAVPAKPTPMAFTQPDGTTVMLRKIGDERQHMTLTIDGYAVMLDAEGYFCYADIDASGQVKATSVRAQDAGRLNSADIKTIERIDKVKVRNAILSNRTSDRFSVPQRMGSHGGIGLTDDAFLGRKELKGLVILAQYSDVKFSETCTRDFFLEMLNSEGFNKFGGTGSARDYFIASSTGQFVPTFDVYGPVTLPNPQKYYGGNDSNGDDKNAARMIYDACKGLDDEINFKDYDLDGDGYVDNVFVFYAGYGEASYGSDDTVWPHQWNLTSAKLSLTLDGVRINKYACSNELELDASRKPQPDGIGTFVHEFSHVLGLPDLYATNTNGYWTPGSWSILDQGSYNNDSRTPPAYSIYERNALGWIDPIVIDRAETITLEDINRSNQGCLIATDNKNEFFLLENRQQEGWDKYIPGHGLLVWHIDFDSNVWYRNAVNNTSTHSHVDIEEASGSWADPQDFADRNGYIDYNAYMRALADYAFPGSKGITSFTDETTPSMKTWAGTSLKLPITNIEENDGVITFNVLGGRCDAAVPVIDVPAEVGNDYFIAAWNPAEGAVEYFLTVYAAVKEGVEQTEIADFGSSDKAVLPEGWSFISSNGDVYTTSGNYGESSPSLKLNKTGAGFMTKEYNSNVKSISFWLKGQTTDKKSNVIIEGMIDGTWQNLSTVIPQSMKVSNIVIDNIPEGVRKVRVTYYKSLGNVSIDDFKVVYGGAGNVTLPDYNALPVGNVTSFKVDKLRDDVQEYIYKVCAADEGAHRTAFSDEQHVILGQNAGIESAVADIDGTLTISGRTVKYNGKAGDRVVLTDISGRICDEAVADADGKAAVKAPSAGVYVATAPGSATKLIVK